jgi:hypothetical protein
MKFKFLLCFLGALIIGLCLTSCQSDGYYMSRAVERARKYALRRTRDLDEVQRNYIRYARPVLKESAIFTRADSSPESKQNITQTCIIWSPPTLDYEIVVFSVSERRLDDWHPEKLIRKRFVPYDSNISEAQTEAVKYAMNNMLYLSTKARNGIRFSEPRLIISDFELYDEKIKKALKKSYKDYIKKLNKVKEFLAKIRKGDKEDVFIQSSFVWESDEKGEKAVITGLGGVNLSDWIPITATLHKNEEVAEHTFYRKTAYLAGRKYALYNLPKLNEELIDLIRKATPKVLRTDFALDESEDKKEDTDEYQISFIWDTEVTDEKVVVSGWGTTEFVKWTPLKASYRTVEDIEDHNISKKEAINKARKAALKQEPPLTEKEKKFIEENKPIQLKTDFFLGLKYDEKLKEEDGEIKWVQTSFVWPLGKNKHITVSGIGEENLISWFPVSVEQKTRKELIEHNIVIQSAIKHARIYAEDNPANISYKEEDRISTEDPKIYETDFDLLKIIKQVSGKVKHIQEKDDDIQWSFVWKADQKDTSVVIIGLGKKDMDKWQPHVIAIMKDKELKHYIFK